MWIFCRSYVFNVVHAAKVRSLVSLSSKPSMFHVIRRNVFLGGSLGVEVDELQDAFTLAWLVDPVLAVDTEEVVVEVDGEVLKKKGKWHLLKGYYANLTYLYYSSIIAK